MSNINHQNCTICNAVFINIDSKICHYCNLVGSSKKQFNCTSHISKDNKKRIAKFIASKKGTLFNPYNESMPFIKEHLDIDIDFKGVRSIISSEYYKSIAFD